MHRSVGPILLGLMALACTAWAQNPPGKEIFEDRCGTCHGADGNGGERGADPLADAATGLDGNLIGATAPDEKARRSTRMPTRTTVLPPNRKSRAAATARSPSAPRPPG